MAKPIDIEGKLDEVDKMWNMAFDDYKDSHDDDKEPFIGDESDRGDLGSTPKPHLMVGKSKLAVTKVLSKPSYYEPMTITITMPSLVGTINLQPAHDLNVMLINFVTSQLLGMTMNSMHNNSKNICFNL
jgi:hypothetical protein